MGLGFMKFNNFGSHKVIKSYVLSAYVFVIFEILSDPPAPILISICFNMLLLGVLKLQNTYILPLVDVSICFTPLLDFVLNACSKVDIHFVLFEFVVALP